MLKISKGLKKKKKSKNKKEDDLFKPEELEQYRREHQQQDKEVTEGDENAPKSSVENDEWKKFKQLTAGVDDILKKTQGDLDRIKSTSFFQKKAPPPKPEPPKVKETLPSPEWALSNFEEHQVGKELPEAKVLDEDSESEFEEEKDDIFDTSFVDVVASGEIQLAYIPESPTEENTEQDFDPFDTTVAEKIIKGPEVSKRGKKLVSIGSAVEVLTGRVEHLNTSALTKKSSRRVVKQDLLLESSDDIPVVESIKEKPVKKSLLDDDEILPLNEPIDLSKSITPIVQKLDNSLEKNQEVQNTTQLDINEFDTLNKEADELDEEFANLAVESLNKPVLNINEINTQINNTDSKLNNIATNWDAFGNAQNLENTLNPPVVKNLLDGSLTNLSHLQKDPIPLSEVSVESELSAYSDPFDTSVVDQIKFPGKAELRFIEAELFSDIKTKEIEVEDIEDDDFDPRKDDNQNLSNNILKANNFEDLEENFEEDPFDTSFVSNVGPGKAELKIIESELANLDSTTIKINSAGSEKLQQILSEADKLNKPNSLDFNKSDLLGVEKTNINTKVLTPAKESSELLYSDPFDTSINIDIQPGKAELKILESELLSTQIVLPKPISLEEVLPSINKKEPEKPAVSLDLLSGEDNSQVEFKPLTPQRESTELPDDYDPFDTSITVDLVPGKTELKLLESELIN